MHLILPKNRPVLEKYRNLPMFFLAGPIQGGGDWHYDMAAFLRNSVGECVIVNPSRYAPEHPHFRHRIEGPAEFERQTDWERHYLQLAASEWPGGGSIIFWLPCESREQPRTDGLPYAMDTRGELGEWRGRLMHNPRLRVVIGAEAGFPGLSQIERNFKLALGNGFKIHTNPNEVVFYAREFAQSGKAHSVRMPA